MRPTRLVLHISARNPKTDRVFADIDEVRKFHVDVRGWNDVGYHYCIKKDGTIQAGRAEDVQGAHCKEANKDSLGICLLAENGMFTMAQVASLQFLVKSLCLKYLIPYARVYGHRDFTDKKTCPDFDRAVLRRMLQGGRL